jgi:chromosomal replication initiation ATPase DnaA
MRARFRGITMADAFTKIIQAVAEELGTGVRSFLAQDRRRSLSWPRQMAMALCRELPRASYHAVGHAFSRDPKTVWSAERAVARRMTPELAELMETIRQRVRARDS